MTNSITQDMAFRQSLMQYAKKYGVSRAGRKYKKVVLTYIQPVKESLFSGSENRGFNIYRANKRENSEETGVIPTPICQLFQIHGSKFKPDPSCDGGQASVVCITHRVFLFCVRKNPFNGFLSLGIDALAQVGFADGLHKIQILLPDVGCE